MITRPTEKTKLILALVMLAVAVVGLVRYYKSRNPPEGLAWFYDLSEKKLFTAPHASVPPIRGIAGNEEDGVRAVVVTTSGNCSEQKSRRILYLETYSPELKFQVELRKSNRTELPPEDRPAIRRGEAHNFILVKRVEDANWYPSTSVEGVSLVNSVHQPGPDGKVYTVCVP